MSAPTETPTGASWEELARSGAAQEAEAPAARRLELVTFELDGDPFAAPVAQVREIVRLRPITPVPRVPDAVRGVISLRGEIAQVLDLRRCLGLKPAVASRSSRIIVIHGEEGGVCGLLVDAVRDVLRIDEDETLAPPPGEGDLVVALCPRGDSFVSLLDLERVIELGLARTS